MIYKLYGVNWAKCLEGRETAAAERASFEALSEHFSNAVHLCNNRADKQPICMKPEIHLKSVCRVQEICSKQGTRWFDFIGRDSQKLIAVLAQRIVPGISKYLSLERNSPYSENELFKKKRERNCVSWNPNSYHNTKPLKSETSVWNSVVFSMNKNDNSHSWISEMQ